MKVLVIVIGAIALVVGLSALVALIFMLLWNAVMVGTFGLPALSFFAAWGLMILLQFIGAAFRTTTARSLQK